MGQVIHSANSRWEGDFLAGLIIFGAATVNLWLGCTGRLRRTNCLWAHLAWRGFGGFTSTGFYNSLGKAAFRPAKYYRTPMTFVPWRLQVRQLRCVCGFRTILGKPPKGNLTNVSQGAL